MTPTNKSEFSDLIKPLSASGFPFQTAIARRIRQLGTYEVEEEIGWRDRDRTDKFIDVVASAAGVRLIVECKKTADEYIFLLPNDVSSDAHQGAVSVVFLRRKNIRQPTWGRIDVEPVSFESIFCVCKTQ